MTTARCISCGALLDRPTPTTHAPKCPFAVLTERTR